MAGGLFDARGSRNQLQADPNQSNEESLGFMNSVKGGFGNTIGPIKDLIAKFSGAKMPTGNQVIGTDKSRAESPAGKMFSGDRGQIIAQSLLDLDKRAAMQPVLETEALFKAFGKGGGLSDIAEKGTLGADPLSDLAEGQLLKQKQDQENRLREAYIKKIEGGSSKNSEERGSATSNLPGAYQTGVSLENLVNQRRGQRNA